jgi:hypothetical protein
VNVKRVVIIGPLSDKSLVSAGGEALKGIAALIKGAQVTFRGRAWKYRAL